MVEVSRGNPIWSLGMMSGTSMDGLDLAYVFTDGERIEGFGSTFFVPLWPSIKERLQAWTVKIAAQRRATWEGRSEWPGWLLLLENDISHWHRWAIDGCRGNMPEMWDTAAGYPDGFCIGAHGQTVLHRPADGLTVQLLRPDFYPDVATVTDFRSADMDAGGQGAPLTPFYHFALARHIGATEPLAFLNIGGVGNVTWVDPSKEAPEDEGALIAFDTGPGNALINDWMVAKTGELLDRDGAAAAKGQVIEGRLASISGQAYLDRLPPKSLDRNDFRPMLDAVAGLSTEDGAATLTAFTADCVAASLRHMPSPPTRWLVCGGGRRNLTLMRMLAARLDAPVDPVEAVGLDGDMLEAQAFAYLAVRVLRGLPTSAPATTGCRAPVCGGRISYP